MHRTGTENTPISLANCQECCLCTLTASHTLPRFSDPSKHWLKVTPLLLPTEDPQVQTVPVSAAIPCFFACQGICYVSIFPASLLPLRAFSSTCDVLFTQHNCEVALAESVLHVFHPPTALEGKEKKGQRDDSNKGHDRAMQGITGGGIEGQERQQHRKVKLYIYHVKLQ